MEEQPDGIERFPLIDALDHEILMHRDAHFGGQFPIMLEYYRQEGKGVQPDFTIERIETLAALEREINENLAALYLSGQEAERVSEAREAYQTLRAIYEVKKPQSPIPRLLADLILSEEEEAEAEVAALAAAEKDKVVPALLDLLSNETFYNPLFPGYGLAPSLAVKTLGRIGDKRAIITLFESIGQGDFFADDAILKALKEIGEPAKQFLLKVIKGRPLNEDNERAAIGLIAFKEDPQVSQACFKLLQEPDFQEDLCLPTYLVLACEGLRGTSEEKVFRDMAKQAQLSKQLREDMLGIIHTWEGTP